MEPTRPQDLLGEPLPDLELPDQHGAPFRLRGRVSVSPLVLFFILRTGTPG